jgi:hypothetical protein
VPTDHQLKITLKHVTPPVWRRVVLPSDCSLAEVAALLLTAMGWAGYHLYSFRIGDATYVDLDDDWPEDAIDPSTVRLGDLVGPGDTFAFEYDFGDGWEHQVVVEKLLPSERRGRPVCVAGRRACPPEDVGGPAGYADFLAAIADPSHDRHDEMLDWIGGSFDPESFAAAAVDLASPVQLYPPD